MPVPQFLAGLGLATKACLGAATAAAVVGGVGVAGALPTPAQSSFDRVAPFETGDQSGEQTGETPDATTTTITTTSTTTSTTTATTTTTDPVDEGDEPPAENFGAWVSEQARRGGADGREVSAAAHARNEARREARAEADGTEAETADDADRVEARAKGGTGRAKGRR